MSHRPNSAKPSPYNCSTCNRYEGSQRTRPEFDEYAAGGYSAGMENRAKRLAGQDAAVFIDLKVSWLMEDLKRHPLDGGESTRVLDYGCGTGLFLRRLRHFNFSGTMCGCDPSSGMLEQARGGWRTVAPEFVHFDGQHLPYSDGSFNLVIACAVLHHIPVTERGAVYREITRVLTVGGRLCVFEHNPWNPITRWVVAHTPIDRDAVLLTAREVREGMRGAGLTPARTANMMFVPPRFRWAWRFEHYASRIPFGGQYATVADKR